MANNVVLVRHGTTEWSLNGRHTGKTDLPLTDDGRLGAQKLGGTLQPLGLTAIWSSPRRRALDTAKLALGDDTAVEVTEDLAEWDYGDYEGITTPDIRKTVPDWNLWTDGCPNGESPADIKVRVDRLIERLEATSGTVACFAHGHILRAVGARWLDLDLPMGKRLVLHTATVSILGHERGARSIVRWNAP